MRTLLVFHICFGTIGLLAGVVPSVLPKGTALHVRVGWVYSVSMSLMALSALVLTEFRMTAFLTPIALLTLTNVWVGHSILHARTSKAWGAFAKTTALLSVLPLPYFLYAALPGLTRGQLPSILWMVAITLLLLGGLATWSYLRGAPNSKVRLRIHAGQMLGSYMGAWIAFLINAVSTDPLVLLPPVVIGSGLIIYWSNAIKKGWRMPRLLLHQQPRH